MADYYTQIVVTPPIPLRCMTKFEDWLLSIIFKHDILTDGPEKYFYSRENIYPILTIDSHIADIFKSELTAFENNFQNDNELVIDDELIIKLFQQILMRDKSLERVDVISAYTCSSMRPDGFGGKKLIILKDSYCVIDTNSEVLIKSRNDEHWSTIDSLDDIFTKSATLSDRVVVVKALEKVVENRKNRNFIELNDEIPTERLKELIEEFVVRNGSQLDDYSSTIQMKTVDTPETKWPFLSDPKICRALGIAARVGFEKALHLSDEHLSDPNQFTRDDWTRVEEVILGLENTQ